MSNNQISLSLSDEFTINKSPIIYKDIIVDRKSKYTIVWAKVKSKEEIDKFMKNLVTDDYYRKATHNTYAYRVKLENWSVLEWKNDDWETWAWMCILRELQRENAIDLLLIVTRYFWWIKLQSDRFKNVINACKMFFDKQK